MVTPNQSILLVEDSLEDFEMTVRSLKKAGLKNTIHHCCDGDDALDYLYHRGAYADAMDARLPGIILLDLNMPGTDGRDVLEELKNDPALNHIPVIVLTTSADERDVQDCYGMGANSFIQKPLDFEGFMNAMTKLNDYWFEVVILPKQLEGVQ